MRCDVVFEVVSPSIHTIAKSKYYLGSPFGLDFYLFYFYTPDGSCCELAMGITYGRILENIWKQDMVMFPWHFLPHVRLWHPPFRILDIQAFKGNRDIWEGLIIAVGGCGRWMADRGSLLRKANRLGRQVWEGQRCGGKDIHSFKLWWFSMILWEQFTLFCMGALCTQGNKRKGKNPKVRYTESQWNQLSDKTSIRSNLNPKSTLKSCTSLRSNHYTYMNCQWRTPEMFKSAQKIRWSTLNLAEVDFEIPDMNLRTLWYKNMQSWGDVRVIYSTTVQCWQDYYGLGRKSGMFSLSFCSQ